MNVLSDLQYKLIMEHANGAGVAFAVIDTLPDDKDAVKEEFSKGQEAAEGLIQMGLATDISDKFAEGIQVSKLNNNGRGYRVLLLTDATVAMFKKTGRELLAQ